MLIQCYERPIKKEETSAMCMSVSTIQLWVWSGGVEILHNMY